MYRAQPPPRKYEEYAYVLDFNSRGKSSTVRGREGIIVTAIGEDRLTLLEVLGIPNSTFEIGEKIYIGKDGRTKVLSVLGKMEYDKISSSAQSELQTVVQTIVTAIGEDRLTLLEILGIPNTTFEIGEKIYIGKDGRTKVLSVLGKMEYDKISSSAQSELPTVVQTIVTANESKFVEYLNNARPLTPRIHALELIPGIGKTYMKTMLEEREKKKFESYQDLQDRVGFKDPVKHISERIMDEITGESRMNLFVKR